MAMQIMLVGFIIFLAHLFATLFDRKNIPDVLPLVLLGLVLGPVTRLVTPEYFGGVGGVLTTVALIVILFQSGLELNLANLLKSLASGMKLTVINFIITLLFVALAAVSLFHITIIEGLVLGSILGGTSSAIVIPLIKKLRLKEESRTILFLESTFSDVLCIVVTIVLLQAIKYHSLSPGLLCGQIIASFLLAILIGSTAAFLWSTLLHKVRHLKNGIFLSPAFVFILYGVAEFLGYSGAIAALAFGVTLGNIYDLNIPVFKGLILFKKVKFNEVENIFFSEIVFLLKTFFFVYIGLSVKINSLFIIYGSLVITLLIFFLRIPVTFLAMQKVVKRFDISIISIMVPKGLAAAVLASLPVQAGIQYGALIQEIVFSIIIFSIIITSILIFLIERNLLRHFYAVVFSGYAQEDVAVIITADQERKIS